MTTLKQRLERATATENVPASLWVSKDEMRIRSSIPDAETLPARAAGYSWGRKDENARLQPILAALIELVHNAETATRMMKETGIDKVDDSEPERQMYDCFCKALANLEKVIGGEG